MRRAPVGPVTLAHGNGGRRMRELIEDIFAHHFGALDTGVDAAAVPADDAPGQLVVTTDAFTVEPLEFPGGDIGALAIHGTVNDLAVSGADPLCLSLAAVIEEGLPLPLLDRVVARAARAATACGVPVIAGDTKVVRRGEAAGLYLVTTGLGRRPVGVRLGLDAIAAGDVVLVSGPVGDHGASVLLARGEFGLAGDLASDCASLLPLARALRGLPGLKFLRDPTRGGLATVAHEIARARGLGVRLDGPAIPIRPPVAAVCEILGFDPLYLACEGRLLAVVAPESAGAALAALRACAEGERAAIIGAITEGPPWVVLTTEIGGERILDELDDEPLPRIC